MKKVNFIRHQESEEGEASSRTTTYAPVDYVGELRISRFRMSKEIFPLTLITSTERPFTDEEISSSLFRNRTPTDIVFVFRFALPGEGTYGQVSNGVCYMTDGTSISGIYRLENSEMSEASHITPRNTSHICIAHLFINKVPIWKEGRIPGKKYVEYTEEVIYDWDEIFTVKGSGQPTDKFYWHTEIIPLEGYDVQREALFYMNVHSKTAGRDYPVEVSFNYTQEEGGTLFSTPILTISLQALKLLGWEDKARYNTFWVGNADSELPDVQDPYFFEGVWMHTPFLEQKYSGEFASLLNGSEYHGTTIQFHTTFSSNVFSLPSSYFPYDTILITCGDLNFKGESISIDSTTQGVISPSSIPILRSFYLVCHDFQRSDFIYINDQLNIAPILVNSPRLASLTIRLLFLSKTGRIIPMKMPAGSSFSIQLTIV